MPDMKIHHESGAILFHLTPQEQQVEDMKKELQKELEEVKALKAELKELQKMVKKTKKG